MCKNRGLVSAVVVSIGNLNKKSLNKRINHFIKILKGSFKDLLPIIIVIGFFQAFILQQYPENFLSIVIGLLIVVFGLAVFILGLEIGIFPLGEDLAHEFALKGSVLWLMLFAFLIGFSTTVAEPALIAIANKAQFISDGRIDAFTLRTIVALAVGFAIALGVFRIILGHPIHWYIISGYILVVCVTYFAPEEIVGLAYDSGGVTTSTVTVPLVAALGIGLASSIRGRNPVIDGFGLIAFASLVPMIFVQVYGIFVYSFGEADLAAAVVSTMTEATTHEARSTFMVFFIEFLLVLKDLVPIIVVIFFFQFAVIRKSLPHYKNVLWGFFYVIVGLYSFILGLEMGLFPIGESMAYQLTENNNLWLIYLFGFTIGFSTTMAEPALIAVAFKAKEVSEGSIDDFTLRIFVAFGVAIGIGLGCYRIVEGDSIVYYIIAGYVGVIFLTYFAPRYIVPIAYDSGGVTTSTVTVPLVAALGLGLATHIDGRNPLIDGFGLIAFASLFPMLTVMGYGIISEHFLKKRKSVDS